MMQATDVQMIADRWMLESRRLINWGSYAVSYTHLTLPTT